MLVLSSKEGKQFYHNIVSQWGKKKGLDFSLLKLDDLSIAFTIRINYKNTYYALETAYNQTFFNYSPGLVVQSLLLERLFAEGEIKRYELGEIDGYKKRWSSDYKPEAKFIIYNKTAYAEFLFCIRRLLKNARVKAKKKFRKMICI